MRRKFSMLVLFLTVALATTMILFSAPTPAANLDGSTWNTDYGIMQFTQSGNSVTGTYASDNGELTGTLEGQDLKGWWSEAGNEKECGPGNAWSGPLVFHFAGDWMSFKGDWGYCPLSPDDLDPDNPLTMWNGTRVATTTTTEPNTSTTTAPASTTTSTITGSNTTTCPYLVCGEGECCSRFEICCMGTCCGSEGWSCFGMVLCVPNFCFLSQIYGEYSEEVELLRDFRDEVLSQSPVGHEIVELYYQWSPMIVRAMEEDEAFKAEVKDVIDGILPLIGREVK